MQAWSPNRKSWLKCLYLRHCFRHLSWTSHPDDYEPLDVLSNVKLLVVRGRLSEPAVAALDVHWPSSGKFTCSLYCFGLRLADGAGSLCIRLDNCPAVGMLFHDDCNVLTHRRCAAPLIGFLYRRFLDAI